MKRVVFGFKSHIVVSSGLRVGVVKSWGQVGSVLSGCALDDERGSRGVFQFGDQNGMPPLKVFNPGGSVVAALDLDYLWRRAAGPGEVEKIGIGCYDREPVGPCILPNTFVRGEPGETRIENGNGSGEKPRKTANDLRRQIRVK